MCLLKKYLYNLVTGKTSGVFANILRVLLFMLSLIYGLVVIILSSLYRIRPVRFSAKVISVGNITLGGTGKTTFVEYLAGKLNSQGHKVAILSRGYKRNLKHEGAQNIGDEPAMLERKLPFTKVVVDKDRVKAAFKAIKDFTADTLILDDGMQQWRIHKDLEIVTIDSAYPFGNYRMLPAGFLREPMGALKRADVFVLTQNPPLEDTGLLSAKLMNINPRALIIEALRHPMGFCTIADADKLLPLDSLKGKNVALFCGIGNPEGFENSITALGINIAKSIRFSDHHDYTHTDIYNIITQAHNENLDAVITTQKDAVKIRGLGVTGSDILVLDIRLEIVKNEAEFYCRLHKLYSL